MDKALTKADLQQAVTDVGRHFSEVLRTHSSTMTERFNKIDGRLGHIDQQFTEVNAKLDAIMEMVAMRKELRALVGQLQAKGIDLDQSQIFVA